MKQTAFIQSLVENKTKAVSTVCPSKPSRREFSKVFHLKKSGESLEVCKEMFLNVLGITNWKVNSAFQQSVVGVTAAVLKPRNPRPSKGFPWSDSDQEFLASFFVEIAKAPISDSKKIYLDAVFKTMSQLHQVYVVRCNGAGKQPFAIKKLTDYFHKNNYSLFQVSKFR